MSLDIASRNRVHPLFDITEHIGDPSIKKAYTLMNNRLVMLMHHGIKDKPGKCREIVPREVLRPEKGSAAGSVGVKPH
jgi:hypothetical protein